SNMARATPAPLPLFWFAFFGSRAERSASASCPPSPSSRARARDLNLFSTAAGNDRNSGATAPQQTTPVAAGPRARFIPIAIALLISASGCLSRSSATDQTLSLAPLPIGRPMYQMDAQHTGRSPYIGPRQPLLLRTFNTSFV